MAPTAKEAVHRMSRPDFAPGIKKVTSGVEEPFRAIIPRSTSQEKSHRRISALSRRSGVITMSKGCSDAESAQEARVPFG